MHTDPTQIEAVARWAGSYGRLMTLAAQALKWSNASREAVRFALGGEGDYIGLAHIRTQRDTANHHYVSAAVALRGAGLSPTETTETLVQVARDLRVVVESEWGHSAVPGDEPAPWDHLALPIVQVRG